MKKISRIVLLIISIFVFFIQFVSITKAYSTSQYNIDIPSNYILEGEGEFVAPDNSVYIGIESANDNSFQYLEYKSEYLEIYKDFFNSYKNEISNYIPAGYEYTYKMKDEKITRFTDNNYKCFYFLHQITIEDYDLYFKQYIVVSGITMYSIVLGGTEEQINSREVKDILNSFTINNFVPTDDSPIFPSDSILIIIAIIFILVVIVLYIMKKNDDRKIQIKKIYSSDEFIDLNDYNVGNSYYKQEDTNKNNNQPKVNISNRSKKISKSTFALLIALVIFGIGTIGAIVLGNPFIILDTIITVLAYMFYPFICIKSNEKYTNKEALKIAIINSTVIALAFAVIRNITTDMFSISAPAAVLYGYINYYLLKEEDKQETNPVYEKENDEKLDELIKNIENKKVTKENK